jgi:hypothetical protein
MMCVATLAIFPSGCEGLISNGPADEDGVVAPPPPAERPDPDVDGDGLPDPQYHFNLGATVSFPGIRMLTRTELARSIAAVTGVAIDTSELPEELVHYNLSNDAAHLTVRDVEHMRKLLRLATDVALAVDIDTVLPCGADPCTNEEIAATARRTFTASPSDEELAAYRMRYDEAHTEKGHDFARRSVLQVLLISPHFLYRTEIGDGTQLTAVELARKLSYFLWGRPPDATLSEYALDGSLLEDATYAAEVDRLLASPNTQELVTTIILEWLGADRFDLQAKSAAADLPAGFEAAMREEAERMIADTLFVREGPLRNLFLREDTFVNGSLAAHYGLEGVSGAEFVPTSLDGTGRRGILTTALVLAAHSKEDGRSPMQRGRFLVEELMCHGFPPEAGAAVMELPEGREGQTFRDRFTPLETTAPCSYCHRTLNAGFAFDAYDAVGREFEAGQVLPEETQGFFNLPPYEIVEFTNTVEAVEGLANHPALPRCFVTQTYRFAQGRTPGAQDAATLEGLFTSFETNDQNVLALLRAVALSEPFRTVLRAP